MRQYFEATTGDPHKDIERTGGVLLDKPKYLKLSSISMDDLDLTCPITLETFKDPVRLVGDRSNTVFEREAIEEWLETHSTVPTTGEEIGMAGRKIVDDLEMRRRVEAAEARLYRLPEIARRGAAMPSLPHRACSPGFPHE